MTRIVMANVEGKPAYRELDKPLIIERIGLNLVTGLKPDM
jgi:hypothetical protein